jgi:hypothetical protein
MNLCCIPSTKILLMDSFEPLLDLIPLIPSNCAVLVVAPNPVKLQNPN